ncbi:acyltransferase family protein [Arachidicoccus terrestris]|uniref:acyltransferase family protein n=1 Tax=Arachidicoccus terrestris TaxID=2875539 RepID=UPI001CC4BA05|nr:acyltransferase [Arachidicoccus terrestris]UAY55452.1 acyltransferase [Arachidicoccus terrestris]
MKEKGKIKSIIAIRGVAVALVMLNHFFSERALDIKSDGLASATLPLGHIGVTLFFIVSGFVLPYSMYKSEYEIKNFPRYLYRRAVRIEPPYIASIFLVLLCMYTKHLIGQTVNYSGGLIGFFSQFLYLNDILGLPWLNIVYWTLALEFQFYLLIGLLFPLLNRYNSFKLLIALVLMVFLKFLSTQHSCVCKLPFK